MILLHLYGKLLSFALLSYEPRHENSINMVCATSKAHMPSLIRAFASHLNIMLAKLLAQHYLEFLSIKGGCTCSSKVYTCQNTILLEITCCGYSDISLKKHKLQLSCLLCCNHTCYCVNMVSVTSASRYITTGSRYHQPYQSGSLMYIRGLIPRNFEELAEAVPIA